MTTAVQLAQSVAPGVSLGFKNRIINGGMTIDQRNAGASVSVTDSSQYTLDRWQGVASVASSKFTVQQSSTAPAGFSFSLLATSSSAYSVLSGDYFMVRQRIEGFNTADFAWGTASAQSVTLSFWVRSSLTGSFGAAVVNSANSYSYPFSYTVIAANTWEQKTVTVPGPTAGTWIGATNGIGLQIKFSLGVGSTYSGTAGAWASADLVQPSGSTSVVGTSGATWYITGVQLEVGTAATPFEFRDYGRELAMCMRYYWRLATGNNKALGNVFCYYTSTSLTSDYVLLVPMRAIPSIDQATGTNYFGFEVNSGTDSFNSLSLGSSSTSTCVSVFNNTEASGTAGQAGRCQLNNASAYFGFSAEL